MTGNLDIIWLQYAFAILMVIIFIFLLIKLVELVLPHMLELIDRFVPRIIRFSKDLFPKVWSLLYSGEQESKQQVKQEIHYHYAPLNQHTHNTQTIQDSVYFQKGVQDNPGQPIPQMPLKSCPSCGGHLDPAWKFCPNCSLPLV